MSSTAEYQNAYDSAKRELADLLAQRQETERRIVLVRQSLETLAGLCESEGVRITPSPEASYLLEQTTLADEIRTILRAAWPECVRPRHVKFALQRLGHDLAKYQNPQATIHMVLKRMAESGELEELPIPGEGKKTYRFNGPPPSALPNAKGEIPDEKRDTVGPGALLDFMPRGNGRGRGRRGSRDRHRRRG